MKTEPFPHLREQASSRLQIGQKPEEVTWTGSDGQTQSLSGYLGAPVVLAFFPARWDPAQELQLDLFNSFLAELPDKVQTLYLSSKADSFAASLDATGDCEFPLVENLDPRGALAAALGIEAESALVVLDPQGKLAYRHEGAGHLPPADELMAALAGLPRSSVSRRQFVFTAVATLAAVMLLPSGASGADTLTHPALPAQEAHTTLHVNGQTYRIPADPRITVLDALRERIGLTGTKKGCDHGQCGACTIHVDGRRMNSCLLLAAQAEGAHITTIEGLAHGEELHPVQEAFIRHDGFQCGYCTPGQIMSAVACIKEGHTKSPEEIREWMSGNICRCGAYQGILEAVQDASKTMGGAA